MSIPHRPAHQSLYADVLGDTDLGTAIIGENLHLAALMAKLSRGVRTVANGAANAYMQTHPFNPSVKTLWDHNLLLKFSAGYTDDSLCLSKKGSFAKEQCFVRDDCGDWNNWIDAGEGTSRSRRNTAKAPRYIMLREPELKPRNDGMDFAKVEKYFSGCDHFKSLVQTFQPAQDIEEDRRNFIVHMDNDYIRVYGTMVYGTFVLDIDTYHSTGCMPCAISFRYFTGSKEYTTTLYVGIDDGSVNLRGGDVEIRPDLRHWRGDLQISMYAGDALMSTCQFEKLTRNVKQSTWFAPDKPDLGLIQRLLECAQSLDSKPTPEDVSTFLGYAVKLNAGRAAVRRA
jgi:hypothetical protein